MEERSALVTDSGTRECLTKTQETDSHTALVRGLAEYLRSLELQAADGALTRFSIIHEDWPDTEERASYPGALVSEYGEGGGGTYEGTPIGPGNTHDFPDGTGLRFVATLKLPLSVEVWCSNKAERTRIFTLLEEAFSPVEWMAGVRLALPHYHGLHATYLQTGTAYADSQEDAQRGYFRGLFLAVAEVPVVKLVDARPRLRITSRLTTVSPTGEEVTG